MAPGKHIVILTAVFLLSAFCACAGNTVKYYTAEVVRKYPHDRSSYTQGLFFSGGKLYESTGQYGSSTFREVDLATGNAVRRLDFDAAYFVEGSVILGDRLYVLTWNERVCFVYDARTLGYLGQYYYPREGWGLTTDGSSLIASDGSSEIYFLNPSDMSTLRQLTVRLDGKPVRHVNELEYVDGKIWANVYLTDDIIIINPQTGDVEGVVDCSAVYPRSMRRPGDDVFNGIAVDPSDGAVYVTGKCWGYIYRISLREKKR